MRINGYYDFLAARSVLRVLRILGYLNVGAIAFAFWMQKSPGGVPTLLFVFGGVAIVGTMLFGVLALSANRVSGTTELWPSFRPYVLATSVILGLVALTTGAKWVHQL